MHKNRLWVYWIVLCIGVLGMSASGPWCLCAAGARDEVIVGIGPTSYFAAGYVMARASGMHTQGVFDARGKGLQIWDLKAHLRTYDVIVDSKDYSEFDLRYLAKECNKYDTCLYVVDNGEKDFLSLVDLGRAGAYICSSDVIQRPFSAIEPIAQACRTRGVALLYVCSGRETFMTPGEAEAAGAVVIRGRQR